MEYLSQSARVVEVLLPKRLWATVLSHHTSLICVCSHLRSSRHRERPRVDVFDMARLRLQAPVRRPNSRNMEPRNLLRIHDSLQLKYTGRTQVWWSLFYSAANQHNMLWLVSVFVNQMVSPGWASVKFLSLRKWVWPAAGGGGTTEIHISSSAARGLQPRMVRAHYTLWSHLYFFVIVSVRFICDRTFNLCTCMMLGWFIFEFPFPWFTPVLPY